MTLPCFLKSGISDLIVSPANKQRQYARLAYQQQRRVDVDVFKHNELFLHSDREQPWTVQFGFHPVPHTAVLPFEGSGQSPDRRDEGEYRFRGSEGGLRLSSNRCYSLKIQVLISGELWESLPESK